MWQNLSLFVFLSPGLSGIFELTNIFFFLCIHWNNRGFIFNEVLNLLINILELSISVRMFFPLFCFYICLKRITHFLQHSTDTHCAHGVPKVDQLICNFARRFSSPLQQAHRIPCCILIHNVCKIFYKRWIKISKSFSPSSFFTDFPFCYLW